MNRQGYCQALVEDPDFGWRACFNRSGRLGHRVRLDLPTYWNERDLCGIHRQMAARGVPIVVYARLPGPPPPLVKTSETLLQE